MYRVLLISSIAAKDAIHRSLQNIDNQKRKLFSVGAAIPNGIVNIHLCILSSETQPFIDIYHTEDIIQQRVFFQFYESRKNYARFRDELEGNLRSVKGV